jgi:hypothetical protein
MSSVDTGVLNRMGVKRLTEAVIETNGGSVDRTDSSRWRVTLPPELASHVGERSNSASGTSNPSLDAIASGLDSQGSDPETTLVFDPREDDVEPEVVVVRPGTPFFNSVLDLAGDGTDIAHLRLGIEDLQPHEPPLLETIDADTRVTEFERRFRSSQSGSSLISNPC